MAQQAGAARAIQHVASAPGAPIRRRHRAGAAAVKTDVLDRRTGQDFATALRGMIQEHFVEHRPFDLVGGGLFAPKDVVEEETVLSGAAAGNDFAAVLDDHVGGFDLFLDAQALEGAQAAGQERLADFEAREKLFFDQAGLPTLLGQQGGGRAAGRPTPDD